MIENRKARFEYNILENYTAGIVLLGSEIKCIRDGKANITDAYCIFINGELFIRNMYVAPYDRAQKPHEPKRDRKLLLTKKELKKIDAKLIDKGLTIIPLKVHVNNLIKIEVGIGKGKKLFDKKQSIKERDIDRETKRLIK